jgi:uncharacterized protein
MVVVDRLIGLASPAAALRRAVRLCEGQRFAEAFSLLAFAARASIPEAEYRVARCYLEGSGVPPSRVEGVRRLQRAAARHRGRRRREFSRDHQGARVWFEDGR